MKVSRGEILIEAGVTQNRSVVLVNQVKLFLGGNQRELKIRVSNLSVTTIGNFRYVLRVYRNQLEKYSDSESDADAIIYFLDYTIKIIDKSKTQFSSASFIKRVFDL